MLRQIGMTLGPTKDGPIVTTTNGRNPLNDEPQSLVLQAWGQSLPTTIGLVKGYWTLLNDPWVVYALSQEGRHAVSKFLRQLCDQSVAAVFGDDETRRRITQIVSESPVYPAEGQPRWFNSLTDGPKDYCLSDPTIKRRIALGLTSAVTQVHWSVGIIEQGSREYIQSLCKHVLAPVFGVTLGLDSFPELLAAGRRRPLLSPSDMIEAGVPAMMEELAETALGTDFTVDMWRPVILGFMNEPERRSLGLHYSSDDAQRFEEWCTSYYQRALNYQSSAGGATPQVPASQTLTADDFFDISKGRVMHW